MASGIYSDCEELEVSELDECGYTGGGWAPEDWAPMSTREDSAVPPVLVTGRGEDRQDCIADWRNEEAGSPVIAEGSDDGLCDEEVEAHVPVATAVEPAAAAAKARRAISKLGPCIRPGCTSRSRNKRDHLCFKHGASYPCCKTLGCTKKMQAAGKTGLVGYCQRHRKLLLLESYNVVDIDVVV